MEGNGGVGGRLINFKRKWKWGRGKNKKENRTSQVQKGLFACIVLEVLMIPHSTGWNRVNGKENGFQVGPVHQRYL